MKQLIYVLSACFGLLLTHTAHGQTAAADNKISESITFGEVPKGLALYGVFEGRTMCPEINRQLRGNMPPGCDRLKWQIIFFRDTVTKQPTTYTLVTEMLEYRPVNGKWKIIHGTKADPAAIVYVLEYGQSGKSIHLLKGDENVLFFLDENLEYRVGNADLSYTLNRVQKVRHLSDK